MSRQKPHRIEPHHRSVPAEWDFAVVVFKILYPIGKARELDRIALSAIGLNRWRITDQLTNRLLRLADLVGFEPCTIENRIDRDVFSTVNAVADEVTDYLILVVLFCYVFSPPYLPIPIDAIKVCGSKT